MKLGDFRRRLRGETNPDSVVPCPSCDGRGWSTPGVVSCDECDGKGTIVIGFDPGSGDPERTAMVAMRKESDGTTTVLASETAEAGTSEAELSRRIREKLAEEPTPSAFTDPAAEEMCDRSICLRHPFDYDDTADHRFCDDVKTLGLSMGSRYMMAGGKDYMWRSEPIFNGKATDPRQVVDETPFPGVHARSVYALLVEPYAVPTLARVAEFLGESPKDLKVRAGIECDETGKLTRMIIASAFCCYPADTRACPICGGSGRITTSRPVPGGVSHERPIACGICKGLGRRWSHRPHPERLGSDRRKPTSSVGEAPLDTAGAVWRSAPKRS